MRIFFNARFVLLLGAAVFFAAKAYFILSQTYAMGMPRLGDDAFVHLWRAEQVSHVGVIGALTGKADSESRAVRDITAYCEEATKAPPSRNRDICLRVADNTVVPDVKAGASLLLNLTLRTGLPLKWTYALNEVFIAAFITAGFAIFLFCLFGSASAGVALILLAFLNLLPPQGLAQFIPSTLVIGLSAGLLGIAATSRSWRTHLAIGAVFALLAWVHPVAIVFGGGAAILGFLNVRELWKPKAILISGALALLALTALIFFSSAIRNSMIEVLSSSFIANISSNVATLPTRLGYFFALNWGFCLAFVTSLFWFKNHSDRNSRAVGFTLLCLLILSLAHKTKFFLFDIDLDLFARIFVILAVLAAGYIAKVMLAVSWTFSSWRKAIGAAAIIAVIVPSALAWHKLAIGNMNGRTEVIDDRALRAVVATILPEATIAYGELDLTPNAAFLAGADRLGAIPLAGLGNEQIDRVLADRQPTLLLMPNFKHLNVLSRIGTSSLETRRHGFPASAVDSFAVLTGGENIVSLYLNVENAGEAPATITPISYITKGREARPLPNIVLAPGDRKWFTLEIDAGDAAQRVVFNMPASRLWVRGVAMNAPPRAGIYWPWDAQAGIIWHVRGAPQGQVGGAKFALQMLAKHWNVPLPADAKLLAGARVVNDETGLVFVSTGYSRAP